MLKLSPEDAARRLTSERNIVNVHHQEIQRGRPKDSKDIPEFLSSIIGDVARSEGESRAMGRGGDSQRDIAKSFDVCQKTVSNHATASSIGRTDDARARFKQSREKIRDTALEKLMASMGVISQDKLNDLGPKDASIVAKNLAGVANSMSEHEGTAPTLSVTVYVPQPREESRYRVIDVG